MAIIFMDGFDAYGALDSDISSRMADHWATVSTSSDGIVAKTGRYNGLAMGIRGYLEVGETTADRGVLTSPNFFPSADDDKIFLGFNFKVVFDDQFPDYINLFGDSRLQIDGDRIVVTRSIDSSTSENVANIGISHNTWYSAEAIFTRVSSTGFDLRLYLNNTLQYNSGSDIFFKEADNFVITGGENAGNLVIDDFYVLDESGNSNNSRLGPDVRIDTLLPTAAKDGADVWATNGGDDATDVMNNVPYDTNEFIATTNNDEAQQFEFTNLSGVVIPLASQIRSVAKGENSVAYKHVINDAQVGDSLSLTSNYQQFATIFDQGDLTQAQINNIVGGVSS